VTKWTPNELQSLFGQEETIRLEFKSGRLLEGSTERAAENLSKSVSAFANTEGGLLIIGIGEEKRGKVRVAASEFEGAPAKDSPTHRLQQLIESNVHPPLMGLRIHPVQLTSTGEARIGFVIEV
jgi:predicted HTH transcriptional regulator